MKPDLDKEVVYSKSIIEFLTVANEFCVFSEKVENYSIDDILSFYQKIIPLMYVKGSLLPHINVTDDIIPERFVTEEQWEIIFNQLREKFTSSDEYTTLQKNDYNELVPVPASISDNISDIYQDMKDFVMQYQKGTHYAKENAVNECRNLFFTHWGPRAIKVLLPIHERLLKTTNISTDEE